MSRSLFVLLLLAIASFGCTGCATGGGGSLDSFTGGVSVELYTRRPEKAMARYRVEEDGTISFGGGFDAANAYYTWSRKLTEAEVDEMNALIAEHNLFKLDPVSTKEPPGVYYDVELRSPAERNQIDIKGENEAVHQLYVFLNDLTLGRNDDYLKRLPEATIKERDE